MTDPLGDMTGRFWQNVFKYSLPLVVKETGRIVPVLQCRGPRDIGPGVMAVGSKMEQAVGKRCLVRRSVGVLGRIANHGDMFFELDTGVKLAV